MQHTSGDGDCLPYALIVTKCIVVSLVMPIGPCGKKPVDLLCFECLVSLRSEVLHCEQCLLSRTRPEDAQEESEELLLVGMTACLLQLQQLRLGAGNK